MDSTDEERRAALASVGLDPTTLGEAVASSPSPPHHHPPTRRATYVPLSVAEEEVLRPLFPTKANARVDGMVILNILMRRVVDSIPWRSLPEESAVRARQHRAARKYEFERIVQVAEGLPHIFSKEHRDAFVTLARESAALRERNDWPPLPGYEGYEGY